MARPKEFDPETALGKAMGVFWHRGYANTSIDDLVEGTGVNRYGLYSTFGGKRELFKTALRQYYRHMARRFQSDLRREDASLPEIREFFEGLAELVRSGQGRDGCMICNTATELAPHDAEIGGMVRDLLDDLGGVFSRALDNARERGEVSAVIDPGKTGHYLVGVLQALAVLGRASVDEQTISDIIEVALSRLQ